MAARSKSFKEEHPLGTGRTSTLLDGCDAGLGTDSLSLSSAEKRQAEAARIRDKYPDRIPVSICLLPSCFWYTSPMPVQAAYLALLQVIVEKAEKSEIPDIDKKK